MIKIYYDKSKGSYVFDKNTNRYYLDMHNQFSSCALGYNHPALRTDDFCKEVLSAVKIKTAMCEYDSDWRQEFISEFKDFAGEGYSQFHFACTGSLAVEAAIKTAFAASTKYPKKILVIENGFHGINSFGNFITSRNEWMNERLAGIPHADWVIRKTIEQCEWLTDYYIGVNKIVGVIVEPIQCSYGDNHLQKQILQNIDKVCKQKNIPLIFDEVQTGFGATGKVWYHQHIDIKPDIIVFGKKAQVSGIMVTEKFSKIFNDKWKLSVTFDGDLIDMIRSKYIMRAIKEDNLLDNITKQGEKIINALRELENESLLSVRGIGGIIAFDMTTRSNQNIFVSLAFKNGLLLSPAGEKTIRLRPNLCITDEEVKEFIKLIKTTING